jgi:glucose/mannose transport system substrate-binding protein
MPYVTEDNLTDVALEGRLRQIMQSLIKHLHRFVRDIEPMQAEWASLGGAYFKRCRSKGRRNAVGAKAFPNHPWTEAGIKKLLCVPILCVALLLALGPAWPALAARNKQLEVFSWWTSGGEAVALEALFKVYNHKNPGVEVCNAAITGGGGSAARPVLQTRLAGGNPPDTWQTHSGHELLGHYVQAGYCVPVTFLYQSEGWDRVVPQGLLDQVSKEGEVYAVLVGVHRGNVLWYNKKVLKKHGIKIGDALSFEQFFSAAQKLKASGLVPLATGDAGLWATAELFENTLLGVLGPQGWQKLFGGEMAFDDPQVKQAARLYGRMLDCQNADHSALSWDQAVRAVIQGKAAFTAMGDWTYGELAKAGLKENQDFGWVSSPGTEGAFLVVADGFTLAKDAPHLAEAVAWLEMVGSKEAQETFNALKGSIPVRTDADKGKLGVYQRWSMASFDHDVLLASCVHGEAVPATFQQELNDAISLFVADRNVERFTRALVHAARVSGLAK